MARFYSGGQNRNGKRLSFKKYLAYFGVFSVLLFLSSLLQTTCLSFFGCVPRLTLALSCAIGFLCGEKIGAIAGIFAGVITDVLGGTGAYLSPILFLLCAYLCGALVGWFLSANLPSFLVYSLFVGLAGAIFTVFSCGLFSKDFHLGDIFIKILVPEFFAFLLCVIPSYGIVFAIHSLVNRSADKGKYSHS